MSGCIGGNSYAALFYATEMSIPLTSVKLFKKNLPNAHSRFGDDLKLN